MVSDVTITALGNLYESNVMLLPIFIWTYLLHYLSEHSHFFGLRGQEARGNVKELLCLDLLETFLLQQTLRPKTVLDIIPNNVGQIALKAVTCVTFFLMQRCCIGVVFCEKYKCHIRICGKTKTLYLFIFYLFCNNNKKQPEEIFRVHRFLSLFPCILRRDLEKDVYSRSCENHMKQLKGQSQFFFFFPWEKKTGFLFSTTTWKRHGIIFLRNAVMYWKM